LHPDLDFAIGVRVVKEPFFELFKTRVAWVAVFDQIPCILNVLGRLLRERRVDLRGTFQIRDSDFAVRTHRIASGGRTKEHTPSRREQVSTNSSLISLNVAK